MRDEGAEVVEEDIETSSEPTNGHSAKPEAVKDGDADDDEDMRIEEV